MRLRLFAPVLILSVLIAGTIAAALIAHGSDVSHARDRQRERATEADGAIHAVTDGTVGRLSGLAGALRVDGTLNPGTFREIVQPVLADRALTTTTFVTHVPGNSLAAFERVHGLHVLDARPGGKPTDLRSATFYAVVTYAARPPGAPPRTSRSPVGLNMAADPSRRTGLLAAAMAAAPRVTAPIALGDGKQGLALYVPVFRGSIPRSPVDRIRAVRGWVVGVYRTSRLLTAVSSQAPGIGAFQIADGSAVLGRDRKLRDPLQRRVEVAGRPWTVSISRPGQGGLGSAGIVLLLGGTVTLLTGLLLLGYARRERYASRQVDLAMAARDAGERRAEAERARFRSAFDEAPIGMAIASTEGRLIQANRALSEITGYPRDLLEATSFASITQPDDLVADLAGIERLLAGKVGTYRGETRYFHAEGHAVPIDLSLSVVRDADGDPLHLLAQMQDITERKRFEGQLQYLADHDSLTGLLNRRRFEEELERELATAERYDTTGAVIALDLDNFKYINDSLGHAAGDELIAHVADLLRGRLRRTDILARLGGDEFAMILPKASAEDVQRLADELLDVIRSEAGVRDGELARRVTASLGVARFGGADQLSAEEALVEADIAMYDAKEAGRDRVAVYDDALGREQRMGVRITWVERIRNALEQDRFVLHAQPIAGLSGDERPRYELLLRMLGDDGDLIPPGAFLSVAERFDLVQDIDRWVIARSLDLLAEVQRERPDAILEINLSARSITDADLPDYVAAEARRSGAGLTGLCIEVTETAAIVNVERAKHLARRLRELGCSFALDDFGSGFASFYYLKHLEFDYLKIDGEFIVDLPSSRANQLVVEAVVTIAQGLGKRTVAEFVGDKETLELLREYGVDYAQGFYIGKPGPLDVRTLSSPAA